MQPVGGAGGKRTACAVSILTRPLGRMQLLDPSGVAVRGQVSILTRPLGRMQRPGGQGPIPALWCFNPHPAFGPDATATGRLCTHQGTSFNPHPAFGPDATTLSLLGVWAEWTFQSSPGLWAGCNFGRIRPWGRISSFNPHPAFGPDATRIRGKDTSPVGVSILTRPLGRMQLQGEAGNNPGTAVSILTRPLGRMQRS